MLSIVRASHVLAALLLCGFATPAEAGLRSDPDAGWRDAKSIPELVEVLETWLDANTEYGRRDTTPFVRTISPSMAVSLHGIAGRGHGRTRGLYDGETSTVYLIMPWSPKDAADVSVLLHELVHHRQAPHHFYCPAAQEEAAYRLQDRWLGERGLSADANWIAVILEAGCTPRDIHPD